jgi:hypothetical protein
MKNSRKTPPRHFPYQHPTFGTDKKPKTPRHWEDTVYYLWWSYLKRNDDYLKTCEANGRGKLSALYEDFGDVRGESFKKWWNEDGRGANLFSNPTTEDRISLLVNGEKACVDEGRLVMSVPLSLPQKFLVDKFRKILETHHTGQKGRQYAKFSKAKYQFQGQPNIKALQIGLKIYDQSKANPEMTLWEIGSSLPQFQVELRAYRKGEIPFDLRRIISSTVCRYKKRVANSIENTAKGIFP